MRSRVVVTATVTVVLAVLGWGVAQAATGPQRLQRLAIAQTKLLFAGLKGQQPASPADCNSEAQPPTGFHGVFLLPTLSFGSGDRVFRCEIAAPRVLLDLGGAVASEDTTGNTYTLENGEALTFTRSHLERICDDAVRFFGTAPPATVDDRVVSGRKVSTEAFTVRVRRTAPGTFWEESVKLGHPGRLAAAYCGRKALIRLSVGFHVIHVDLSGFAGAPTRFTYFVNRVS